MDIYRAVKREKKNFNIFVVTMIAIAAILPAIMIVTRLTTIFYISYVIFIEFLIAVSFIIKCNGYRVEYRCLANKLIFKTGIFTSESLIICDKVVLVHTNKSDYDLEIILITNVAFKNKKLHPVEQNFLNKNLEIAKKYQLIKIKNPDSKYYFQVIKRGGLKKYLLLDLIYRQCVKAVYTEQSIQNIKIARGQQIV